MQSIKCYNELFEEDKRRLDRRRGEDEIYDFVSEDVRSRETEVSSDKRALRQLNMHFAKKGKVYQLDSETGRVLLVRKPRIRSTTR